MDFFICFHQKGRFHTIHRDFIKKILRIFRNFLPKGGGGLADSKISLSEKTGASKLLEGGGGGPRNFRVFPRKKNSFFLCLPLSQLYIFALQRGIWIPYCGLEEVFNIHGSTIRGPQFEIFAVY